MPFISVIIPNYNHAPYLRQRIDSVINQTYQDFEIIILDDLSPDNSKEIIEQYRDNSKISHIIYNDVNSGSTFKQWNKGIDLAKGEWVWIAESDDFCENIFLETLVSLIETYKTAGLIYCQSVFYNELENDLSPYRSTNNIIEFIKKENFVEKKLVPFTTLINASMAIFKRDLYKQIPEDYTNYRLAGDWIFWAEIGSLADVVISGKFLNYFRQHSIKVSNNTKKNGFNYFEEINVLKYFKNRFQLDNNKYENALFQHYFRFLYDSFSFNEGVKDKVNKLFFDNFSVKLNKRVRKQILADRFTHRYIPKLLKLFFNEK
ncbi:glycosyltransferase family 2 protein [Chishuiella sp.]|uniref:glycosyltransferase family 2 protein n=1 Tax=Chishuiella sp. TaxID=1969467 RepID=UPI0028B1DAAF|nr:glycosyltransferase family 2 protein [Chishuiella sp.]